MDLLSRFHRRVAVVQHVCMRAASSCLIHFQNTAVIT